LKVEPVLTIDNVSVSYQVQGGEVRAVDGVSLEINRGEIVAVVGESGCGKTTLARAVLGLQKTSGGKITLMGDEVTGTTRNMATKVGMVWQDPYASLNPRWTISRSMMEPASLAGLTIDTAELITEVGLDSRFAERFPHELSGGQRQRVAIGRAISLQPPLIICDEPTSALDLSIRAQILNLLKDIREQKGCAFLYISHDLTTVRFLADRIMVMYMGRIVESGPTEEIFANPKHPYTKALLESAPTLDKLMFLPDPLQGELPDPKIRIKGCRFASRCVRKLDLCHEKDPEATTEGERIFFCHNPN
jgi:oligopeptide/dipeptide ABC transporter ATP-binding protein